MVLGMFYILTGSMSVSCCDTVLQFVRFTVGGNGVENSQDLSILATASVRSE